MIDKDNRFIYPKPLVNIINQHGYIPRKLKDNEKLKVGHRYWLPYYNGIIKISDISNIESTSYYFLTFDNKFNAAIPFPLEVRGGFELLYNFDHIDKKNIINDNNSYTGAEIKFWFIKNNINLFKGKYAGFWSYLDPRGNNTLIDNKKYYIKYDPNSGNGKQRHSISLDKNKSSRT